MTVTFGKQLRNFYRLARSIGKRGRLVGKTDQIVGGEMIKSAQRDQIVDLELGSTRLNVVVALLRFIDDPTDLCLRVVSVLSHTSESASIIHFRSSSVSRFLLKKSYHTQKWSIDNYSKIEYNRFTKINFSEKREKIMNEKQREKGMEIGKVIAAYRAKRGLTLRQLGEALGISAQAVHKWERGINYPDITLIPLLAHTLNISISTLFEE